METLHRPTFAALATVLVLCHGAPRVAHAQTRWVPEGPYTEHRFPATPGGHLSLRWEVTVEENVRRHSQHYWATQFTLQGGSVGYTGLQSGGILPSGDVADLAIFSIWNATGTPDPATRCRPFVELGTGYQCLVAYPWVVGRTYRFDVRRTATSATRHTWTAWVRDLTTGTRTRIGTLRTPPADSGIRDAIQWSEYWPANSCDVLAACRDQPYARVRFGTPIAGAVTPTRTTSWTANNVPTAADCPGRTYRACQSAVIEPVANGVRHEVGVALTCGHRAATGYGPLRSCSRRDPDGVRIGFKSAVAGTFSRQAGPLPLLADTTTVVAARAVGESTSFWFTGGPRVTTAYGPASYGEQRQTNALYGPLLRWGTYNFFTQRFYPLDGWKPDLGS